jgi:hypothetical protein
MKVCILVFFEKSVEKIQVSLKSALYVKIRGVRWRSWFRHRVASRKVAGSIPDGVSGIFH